MLQLHFCVNRPSRMLFTCMTGVFHPLPQARPKILLTAWLLARLGYLINWVKSSAKPFTQEHVLGFHIDICQLMVFLLQEKIDKILRLCTDLIKQKTSCLLTLSSLIGKMKNAPTAILPRPHPLYFRYMQMTNICI